MTSKQIEQFNRMWITLKRISSYDSIERLRRNSGKQYGLDYDEALEYAYENMQHEAKQGIKYIKPIKEKNHA